MKAEVTAPVCTEDQAAEWFARSRSGQMTGQERATFESWLRADPEHGRAYARCQSVWSGLQIIQDEPQILAVRDRVRKMQLRRQWWVIGGSAAVLSVLLAVALVLLMKPYDIRVTSAAADRPARFATEIGHLSHVVLPDGSTVVLDTDSSIALNFDSERRDIRLERGRAFFHVAHEPRPFTVSGERLAVTATGTQFVVELDGSGEVVSMIEGSVLAQAVKASRTHKAISLEGGSRLRDDGQGQWQVGQTDADAATGWMSGRLSYHEQRVADIVREMNRYSRQKIIVADLRLAERRLSAVLVAGDNATLVSAVTDLGMGRVTSRDDDSITLVAK
jgi:transmembrane sensor